MIAGELISKQRLYVQGTDTVRTALMSMNDHERNEIPLLAGDKYIGLLEDKELLSYGQEECLAELDLPLNRKFLHPTEHLFNVLGKFSEWHLTAIPVVDQEEKYIGVLLQDEIVDFYNKSFAFSNPGSIIVLEMDEVAYSLSKLVQIIENEGAKILGIFVSKGESEHQLILTIKLSSLEVLTLKNHLERHNYKIKAIYSEQEYMETLNERYNALMHYLNL